MMFWSVAGRTGGLGRDRGGADMLCGPRSLVDQGAVRCEGYVLCIFDVVSISTSSRVRRQTPRSQCGTDKSTR